jgi:pimeloyl-ACP methyl ester carboxylesterase
MRRIISCVAAWTLYATSFCALPAQAQTAQIAVGLCHDGTLPSGALSRICVPASGWNGDLVVWAHGYTAFNEPLDFQNLNFADGTYLPDLIQSLGFAFATTSYRQNGLAILEGVDDISELVLAFPGVAGRGARRTFLTGASEGGIVTALAVERSPQLYSGGIAACGPVGDFRYQLNYWGDFRVLFDYFFPGVIPGSAIKVPPGVIENWEELYLPAIRLAVEANPSAARQLIRASKAAVDPADPSTTSKTIINLLWYNVFATNDGVAKLGGNPFDNRGRWYWGSNNDLLLNLSVKRYSADPVALNALTAYQTSGRLTRPLITLHTTGDEIIPYLHEYLYLGKARTGAGGALLPITVQRYGHCNFTPQEAVNSFALLLLLTAGT